MTRPQRAAGQQFEIECVDDRGTVQVIDVAHRSRPWSLTRAAVLRSGMVRVSFGETFKDSNWRSSR